MTGPREELLLFPIIPELQDKEADHISHQLQLKPHCKHINANKIHLHFHLIMWQTGVVNEGVLQKNIRPGRSEETRSLHSFNLGSCPLNSASSCKLSYPSFVPFTYIIPISWLYDIHNLPLASVAKQNTSQAYCNQLKNSLVTWNANEMRWLPLSDERCFTWRKIHPDVRANS